MDDSLLLRLSLLSIGLILHHHHRHHHLVHIMSTSTTQPTDKDANFSQLDVSRSHNMASMKNKLCYLVNSGLLLGLPTYIFTGTKGIQLWDNIHILASVYAISVLVFTFTLQKASIARLKSLSASYPRSKESSKVKEAQRKTTLESMAALYSASLLNLLFLALFVFFSGVFFSPLPKLLNYSLSVAGPVAILTFLYRPL